MQVFMQIFVKTLSGKTLILDVEPSYTIAQVKQKAIDKDRDHSLPQFESLKLMLPPWTYLEEEHKTLGDYSIKNGDTLHAKHREPPPAYDPEVLPYLKNVLRELETESGVFIFIGLGCYDHAHGKESIERQQCPENVLKACIDYNLKLRVLLLDPGFDAAKGSPQIYDIDKNWQLAESALKGKYKIYQYQKIDFKLYTFATVVPPKVYGGQDKTLADYDLEKLGAHAISQKSFLVVGNFYAEGNPPHVAMGDTTLLSQLGYIKM